MLSFNAVVAVNLGMQTHLIQLLIHKRCFVDTCGAPVTPVATLVDKGNQVCVSNIDRCCSSLAFTWRLVCVRRRHISTPVHFDESARDPQRGQDGWSAGPTPATSIFSPAH